MTKFMILVDNGTLFRDDLCAEIYNKVVVPEDPTIMMITCPHEKLEDNILTFEGDDFEWFLIKDVEGWLYRFVEVYEKDEVISMWE